MAKTKASLFITLMSSLMGTNGFTLCTRTVLLERKQSSLFMRSVNDRSRRIWIKENCIIFSQQAALLFESSKKESLKSFIFGGIVQTILVPSESAVAETVGKDDNCNSPQCLGVWGGLLASCPHDKLSMTMGAGCAASQDDTPGIFAEPWDYSEAIDLNWEYQMSRLIPAILYACSKRGDDAKILKEEKRYLRVLFTDGKTSERSIGEFYFTPDDTTVQFRVGALLANENNPSLVSAAASISSMKNLERCEAIRKQLGYLKLPVLRNRKRLLFFGESNFDTFGPGSASIGPPAEMRRDELEGLPDFDPNLKTDFSQKFPFVDRKM